MKKREGKEVGQRLLAEKKIRQTRSRGAVLSFLLEAEAPVSVPEMMQSLAEFGERFNKTTLYRELDFLVEQGIVAKAIVFASCQYYEIVREHHHHVVCTHCGDIQDIAAEENFRSAERELLRKRGFQVRGHSLEFFGRCRSCAV